MKHLSKMLVAFVFVFCLFACQESALDSVDKSTNKHSSARTNADWNVTGTTTVPAGTYDYIYVYNGSNITLSNGVNYGLFNWSNFTIGGAPATITVPVGAVVNTDGVNEVYPGGTFNNRGRLTHNYTSSFNPGVMIVRGTFNNYGKHYPVTLAVFGGNYYQRSGGILEAQNTVQDDENGVGGKIIIELCNTAKLGNVQAGVPSQPFLWGRGMFNMNSCAVNTGVLTGDTKTKVCIPVSITYSNGGTFGIGAQTCTNTCLEL